MSLPPRWLLDEATISPSPHPIAALILLLGQGFCVYPFYICVLRCFDIWALLILERHPPTRVGWFLDTASSSPVGLSHANLSSISSLPTAQTQSQSEPQATLPHSCWDKVPGDSGNPFLSTALLHFSYLPSKDCFPCLACLSQRNDHQGLGLVFT